jgi:hypothetical protein
MRFTLNANGLLQYDCPYGGRQLFGRTVAELQEKVQLHHELFHDEWTPTSTVCRPSNPLPSLQRAYRNTTAMGTTS